MRLQGSVSAFTETMQQLQGESYDSIRNYYSSTHLPALRGLICHVEELKAANDKYASQIDTYLGGISYVDEDGLGNSLDMIILAKEQVAAMTEVTAYMRIYDNLLAAMQRGIEDKINKIACFKAATSGIYSTLESDKGLLQTGIACMEGIGFNSKTKTFSMGLANLSWIAKLNEKWKKRIDVDKLSEEVFEKLGDDALTYEEYSNLSEIKQVEYLEKVANQSTTASYGAYVNPFDKSISAEIEVTTSVEKSSIASAIGVKKSINTNIGWEPVPVAEPVPVTVPDEKEWWEEGWNILCDVGETITDSVNNIVDWGFENKEVVGFVGYIGAVAIAAYLTGGVSLAFSF